MTQSVNGMNRSMRTLVNDALARRQAAEDLKQSYYMQAVEEQRARREAELARREAELQQQQAQQVQGEQQAPQQPISPLDDPNSALSQLLKERGLTKDKYLELSTAERQYDFADPILEKKWNTYVAANPEVAAQGGEQLQRTKDAFFNQGRNLYAANFQALEKAESPILNRLGNVAGDAVEGVSELFTGAGGLLKPVFGNDNIVSKGLNYIGEAGKEGGKVLASDVENDREKYFYKLMETGRYKDAAKFAAENPLMLGGEAFQMVAGTKGFGALTKGTAAAAGKGLSKLGAEAAGNSVKTVGTAIGNSMPAYAGMSVGGQVANELAERGIDTTSAEGRLAVALSFVGGAAANKITPHNIENQVAKLGLSKEATQALTRESVETLEKMGFMSAAGKRLAGVTKNAVKGGVNEGAEEFLQEGLGAYAAQALIGKDGKFRSWSEVPDEVKEQVLRRATAGGLLGATLGGTTAGAINGIAGGVHGDVQQNVNYQEAKAKYAAEDAKIAEEEKAAEAARLEEEAIARAQAEEAEQAQQAAQAETEAEMQRQAENDQLIQQASRIADVDSEIQNLRAQYGAASIDSNEVTANRARTDYDNYLNAKYEELRNSPDLTEDQRAVLENTWGDGNKTLRAKANLLQTLGVDTMPEQFTRKQKNGKVVYNYGLDKNLDYRADELTQDAQSKYDEAEVQLQRMRNKGVDEDTINALADELNAAAQTRSKGAISVVARRINYSDTEWDKAQRASAEQAKAEAKAQKVASKTAEAEQLAAEQAEIADIERARATGQDSVLARAGKSQAVKELSPAERIEVQSRLVQDQEFERHLQDTYADRLLATGKAKSKAEALRLAAETPLSDLIFNYRPNKLSRAYNKVKDRLPAEDGLWWTPTERAVVKQEIDDFFKEAGVQESANANNLRASVDGINSLRKNMPPELQDKANAILSAISTGVAAGVMKRADSKAVQALEKANKLKPVEDFTGKSQAPSTGRQMRKASAVKTRSTS